MPSITTILPILLTLLLHTNPVHPFGFVSSPPSRQSSCRTLTITTPQTYLPLCDGSQDEPHRVGSLSGVPFHRNAGAHLCNGNATHWDGLNTQGPNIWPQTLISTPLTSPITIEWELLGTAIGAKFEYYISQPGIDSDSMKRLTKDDFVREPVLETVVGDSIGNGVVKHHLLPEKLAQRDGYVVIFAVFNSVNGKDAFYNCVDLNFVAGGEEGVFVQGEV